MSLSGSERLEIINQGNAAVQNSSLKGGFVPEAELSIGINNAVQPELRVDHLANNVSFARLIFAAR